MLDDVERPYHELSDGDRDALAVRLAGVLAGVLAGETAVRLAYLHGSFVSGTHFRDIDVAVWLTAARHEGTRSREDDRGAGMRR